MWHYIHFLFMYPALHNQLCERFLRDGLWHNIFLCKNFKDSLYSKPLHKKNLSFLISFWCRIFFILLVPLLPKHRIQSINDVWNWLRRNILTVLIHLTDSNTVRNIKSWYRLKYGTVVLKLFLSLLTLISTPTYVQDLPKKMCLENYRKIKINCFKYKL